MNIASQYFGYGLFSYYPCNVNCKFTLRIAKRNYSFLEKAGKNLLDKFDYWQSLSYLYTEHNGIFAFKNLKLLENNIYTYNNKNVIGNSNYVLYDIIKQSNLVEFKNTKKKYLKFYKDSDKTLDLKMKLFFLSVTK